MSHRINIWIALVSLAGANFVAHAQDTDIYLSPNNISRDDSPNVLIVFDNSGSMDELVASRPTYDASVNYYTASGSPQIATGKIYWSTTGSPPPADTSRWFSVTNNNCEASKAVLNASGIYAGVKLVGFKASGTGRGWRALEAGQDRKTDCNADAGATDPNGYVKASNINPFAAYTATASQEINWGGITSTPTLYSANYMNYWYNSTLSTSQTRMQIAKSVVNSIIDANRNLRIGLMVFNFGGVDDTSATDTHGGRVLMKVDNMTDARRTQMKSVVNSLTSSTWTPLTEAMWEAYRYLGGYGVDYGDNDAAALPARDLTAESGTSYISPLGYSCQKAFIILITDGDPTKDGNANSKISALSGISGLSGSYLDDLTGWMNKNDVNTSLSGNQTVVTYTVGFGNGISTAGLALLQSTAIKGGGSYKTATDADQLTAALQSAIIEITTTTSSFVAPALSVNAFNRLFNRDDVYFAMFKPSDTTAWEGNIKKFRLNATGDVVDATGAGAIDFTTQRLKDTAQSYWGTSADGGTVTLGGVGAKMPAPAQRTLYTYRGSYAGLSSTTPAALTKIEAQTGNGFYDAMVANPSLLGLAATASATDVTTLVNWMLGADAYDKDNNTATATRWGMGDPLHGRPVAITYGGTNANPVIKLFVASNDGVIHMFNDMTGVEEWSFIPQEADIMSRQYELSQDTPGTHPHLMDGTPTFWLKDANNNGIVDVGQDKIYMYIGQRRGGRGLYAFDVTPSSTLTDPSAVGGVVPKLIWAINGTNADYQMLGQTWSRPLIKTIRYACTGTVCATGDNESRTVLIFAGGYDPNRDVALAPASSDAMGAAIYIVDPLSGQRIWWASGASGTTPTLTVPGMVFSMPSDLAALDTNSDGAVDRLYVGDVVGQVWRIDLSETLKLNTNAGSTGYLFADLGCVGGTRPNCSTTAPQERRRFFYPPEFVQISDSNYSTVKDYDILFLGSGDREDPLDKLTVNETPAGPVHNRLYALRDYTVKSGPMTTPFPATVTHTTLFDATGNALQSPSSTGYTAALADIRDGNGWYIDLANTTSPAWVGEKSLAKAVVFAGAAYFTTYVPASMTTSTLTCAKDEGLGKMYGVNILTGAASYDYDNDGDIDTLDRQLVVGGGIPSELVVVIRQGGVSGLIGTSGGASKPPVPKDPPRFRTYWTEE